MANGAKIATSVVVSLVGIGIIAIAVLLYRRRQRKKNEHADDLPVPGPLAGERPRPAVGVDPVRAPSLASGLQ